MIVFRQPAFLDLPMPSIVLKYMQTLVRTRRVKLLITLIHDGDQACVSRKRRNTRQQSP